MKKNLFKYNPFNLFKFKSITVYESERKNQFPLRVSVT